MAPRTFNPFYADPDSLPAPLPTTAEIESSTSILSEIEGRKIVRVGEHFVAKYGHVLDEIEGENMIYIRKTTHIPVPNVYAVYSSPTNNMVYIVMEYVLRNSLMAEWSSLSEMQKQNIMEKLKGYFDELRRLPSPGYYGALNHRQMPDSMFWNGDHDLLTNGPFEMEEDLNNALVRKSAQISAWNHRHGYKADFYHRMPPQVLKGHCPVFTHGDFQRKNVIVERVNQPQGQSSNRDSGDDPASGVQGEYKVTIVDWEKSGWYPSYWEYCSASWSFRWDDDCPVNVEGILDPCVDGREDLLKARVGDGHVGLFDSVKEAIN